MRNGCRRPSVLSALYRQAQIRSAQAPTLQGMEENRSQAPQVRHDVRHRLGVEAELIGPPHQRSFKSLAGLHPVGGNQLDHSAHALHHPRVTSRQDHPMDDFAVLEDYLRTLISMRDIGGRIHHRNDHHLSRLQFGKKQKDRGCERHQLKV